MVALAVLGEAPRARGGEENSNVCIHRFEQFVHTFRTQVTSLHHNVSAKLAERFGVCWQPTGEPVWLLGRRYEAPATECSDSPCGEVGQNRHGPSPKGRGRGAPGLAVEAVEGNCGSPEDFAAAWGEIRRMTYRKGFTPMYRCVRPPAAGSDQRRRYIRLTSDAGWGCMIRVGQMLLAMALRRHCSVGDSDDGVGPGTGQADACGEEGSAGKVRQAAPQLDRLFLDDPCAERSPFSIFSFIRAAHGREIVVPPVEDEAETPTGTETAGGSQPSRRQLMRKLPGDWFGPTTISETIAALVEQHEDFRDNLAVYVDADGILYEDEVRALAGVEPQPAASPSPPGSPASGSSVARKQRGPGASFQSEDEFMVLSTASCTASPCNSAVPRKLPGLDDIEWRTSLENSPVLAPSDPGAEFEEAQEADVMQMSSFHELQPGLEFEFSLQLPPPAVGLPPDSLSWDDDDASPRGPGSPGSAHWHPVQGQEATSSPRWSKAVLLLFPLQLGCDRCVSEASVSALLRYFELGTSLGAMGGRPRMAHFFVGRQGSGLLYVDPHFVQPAALPHDDDEAVSGSVGSKAFQNTPTVQVIPVEQIDSSVSLAFYCRSEADLAALLEGLKHIEASEADAPLHAERTRPLALRGAGGRPSVAWCDLDCLETTFAEEEEAEPESESPRSAAHSQAGTEEVAENSRPRCLVVGGGAVGDDCLLECHGVDEEGPQGGSPRPAPAPLEPAAGRMLCVGAPWSDGAWAQVEEQSVAW